MTERRSKVGRGEEGGVERGVGNGGRSWLALAASKCGAKSVASSRTESRPPTSGSKHTKSATAVAVSATPRLS